MTTPSRISTAADLGKILPSICWEWKGFVPRGFVTLLVGIPGVGKSMAGLEIARRIIAPTNWPDGSEGPAMPRNILWCDCESAQALLNERITAWKLPGERIFLPGNDPLASISLSKEVERSYLEKLVKDLAPALVVVDSLGAAHSGDENSTRDMGSVLGFLARLARDHQIAILVVHHLRKLGMGENQTINLDRIRGSSIITSYARVVMALEKVAGGIRLSVAKSNLSKLPEPLGMTIGETGIVFGNAPKLEPTLEEKAVEWLHNTIDKNPKPFKELAPMAQEVGISKRQLYAAKEILEIQTERGRWILPEDDLLDFTQ